MQELSNDDDEMDEDSGDDRPTWIPPSAQRAAGRERAISEEFEAVPPSRHRFPTHRQAFGVGMDD